jgi:hypothetical protein
MNRPTATTGIEAIAKLEQGGSVLCTKQRKGNKKPVTKACHTENEIRNFYRLPIIRVDKHTVEVARRNKNVGQKNEVK